MNVAIVLAGGVGSRMGSNIPKQFIECGGVPVLARTLRAFSACDEIDGIVVVTLAEGLGETRRIIAEFGIEKVKSVIIGGKTRRESSFNGVLEAKRLGADIVLIHDAARPNVTKRIILDNIAAAAEFGACETAIEVTDTVIRVYDGKMGDVVPRENLFRVQTPQSFKTDIIIKCHEKAANLPESERAKVTDDAMMVKNAGIDVVIVRGDYNNIKITTSGDLDLIKT